MACSPEERAQRERLERLYVQGQAPVMRAIERRVCGCDHGGSSWTTRDEADRISVMLGLRPGRHLLEVGAGSGWPGLYLARRTGCDVTLVDLPFSGLRIAAKRALAEGLPGTCLTALADAACLPFGDASFDAISHSDVLCCLRDKGAVLGECRRLIRPEGRMVFTVISVTPGLSPLEHRRAVDNGPEFVEAPAGYPTLLAEAGWIVVDHEDLTAEYAASIRRQIAADDQHRDGLIALIGSAAFAERQREWRAKLSVLDDGLLRRELLVAAPRPAWP